MLITSFSDSLSFSSSVSTFLRIFSGFSSACFKSFLPEALNLSLFLSYLEDLLTFLKTSLNFYSSVNVSGTEFPDSSPNSSSSSSSSLMLFSRCCFIIFNCCSFVNLLIDVFAFILVPSTLT